MNRMTTSLAILAAACIAFALGTLTPSPTFAQTCGKDKDGNPIECEPGGRDKKSASTAIPPTLTYTPTPIPTATSKAAPTPTSTDAAAAAEIVPPAPIPEEDKQPQAGGWWLPAAAALLLIGVITAARRALARPGTHYSDPDFPLDVEPEFEFNRDDVRATLGGGQVSTDVGSGSSPPAELGITPEGPNAPGINNIGGSLFMPGGGPVRADVRTGHQEYRPTRSPRKGATTKSSPSKGSADSGDEGTDDSGEADDE